MKLIGSIPSPFVRRIRILLHGKAYEFLPIDVFSTDGKAILKKYGPIAKIPILENKNDIIWDSLLITKYLIQEKIISSDITIQDQKKIIAINEITDSGVILFQLKKMGTDPEWKNQFSQNHHERIFRTLEWAELSSLVDINAWSLPQQWLFCTLDWYKFRNIIDWNSIQKYHKLIKFYEYNLNRAEVVATSPNI